MAKLPPAMLPDEALYKPLDPESAGVQRLMAFLDEEHHAAMSAYEGYYDQLRTLRKAIKFQPQNRVKTFPWPGASNFVAPLIRINGDAVKARILNTLLAPRPFFVPSAAAPGNRYEPFCKPWQNFLQWGTNDCSFFETAERIVDQAVYLGKCPGKIYWRYEVTKAKSYDPRTKKIVDKFRVAHDHPFIEPILLENWLEPWGLQPSIEKPWLSQRIFKPLIDLKQDQAAGRISESYDLESTLMISMPENILALEELKRRAWQDSQTCELWETNVDFDIDEDGFKENLQVLWDPRVASKPLWVKYNMFWHAKKPYCFWYYLLDGTDQSYGEGIAHLSYQIQEAVSTFINQRTDNITIGNTLWFKGKKGRVKEGMTIWPGKVELMDDPASDLVPEKLGEVSPSSFNNENVFRDYNERVTGISDPQLGREMDNPRVAATTTLSMLQEGNRRFDMIIRMMRMEFAKAGIMVSQLYQQFKPRLPLEDIVSEEDLPYVEALLNMPPEEIEKNFALVVNASSIAANKETERKSLGELYQLVDQFYKNTLAVAQEIANPQAPAELKEMMIEMVRTAYKSIREMVYTFEVADPDGFVMDPTSFLEDIRDGASTAQLEQAMAGAGPPPGMGPMGPGGPAPLNAGPMEAPAGPEMGGPPPGPDLGGGVEAPVPVG